MMDSWKSRYRPIADWDRMFADGGWDYLDEDGEAARYALLAGYVHRRYTTARVLDAGCGTGILFRYFDHSRVHYSGFDLSHTAIQRAKAAMPGGEFKTFDISRDERPFEGSFDVVIFNEVLPHIDDPMTALSHYESYLDPDGILLISTYQNVDRQSNAAMFTMLLDAAAAEGKIKILSSSTVTTSEKGLTWRIDAVVLERR